jgi:hypothetical protein
MVVIYFSGTGNSRFAANYFANLSFLPVKNHPHIDKQIEKVKRVIEKDVQAIRTKHIVVLTGVQRALLQCLFMAKLSDNIKVYNE